MNDGDIGDAGNNGSDDYGSVNDLLSPSTILLIVPSRFALGRLLITPGAEAALKRNEVHLLDLVRQHAQGDWGNLGEEDKQANEAALTSGDRILSSYQLTSGEVIWIITEADRSATTALSPDEY